MKEKIIEKIKMCCNFNAIGFGGSIPLGEGWFCTHSFEKKFVVDIDFLNVDCENIYIDEKNHIFFILNENDEIKLPISIIGKFNIKVI